MKRVPFFFLLAASAVVFGACGGGVDGGASSETAGNAPNAPEPPDPVLGTYHLTQVDATNLQLTADGVYRWTIEGCDFGGGQCGHWTKNDKGEILLTAERLEWSWDGSFKQSMRWLKVKPTAEGVHIEGETDAYEHVEQDWAKGRSCAVCGGNLGPTGQKLCDAPLPDVCLGTR
jgi:hypothetical protein